MLRFGVRSEEEEERSGDARFCCRLRAWSIPPSGCGVLQSGPGGGGGQRAESEHPRWEAAGGAGGSLPMLSPDVISPPRGGSAAKGRFLLSPSAPGSLAGALVIWAVAGDGVCLGSPQAGGTGGWMSLHFWGAAREKAEVCVGGASGLAAHCPPSGYLGGGGGGQRAAVKPDVRRASLAEQVGLNRATFAGLTPAAAPQPHGVTFQSWVWQHGGRGDAVGRQHPTLGMDLGRCPKEGTCVEGCGSLEMRKDSKVPGTHAGPCHVPLPYAGTRGVGRLGLILNLGQNTVQFVLPPAGRQGEARQ